MVHSAIARVLVWHIGAPVNNHERYAIVIIGHNLV